MNKMRFFISNVIEGVPLLGLLNLSQHTPEAGATLFTNKLPKNFAFTSHEFVDSIKEADFVLFPHAIKSKEDPLLPHVQQEVVNAQGYGKYVVVFVGGDLSHNIFIDNAIVFKGSQYRYLLRSNEIIVPPFVEDLTEERPLYVRTKSSMPSISFCGWAGFPSLISYSKYLIRNSVLDIVALMLGQNHRRVHKKGLWFRRTAMRLLGQDSRINTNFITRTTFSASAKTISLPADIARREYIDNISNSDFVLTPKGDGNFSVRFFETLAVGRIPVLIDTDVVLPLESLINYDDFVLKVPYRNLNHIGNIVMDVYEGLTEEKFEAMQRAAREAYVKYLRYDSFFNTLFSSSLLENTKPLSSFETKE